MNITKRMLNLVILFLLLTAAPVILHAQTNPPVDTIDTPIDGGLSLLIAAGVGYGAKKAYDARKKKEDLSK
ncbi:PID-CTERM protein-sorting domain-containing protein [Aridibaculum aurantiacum]|uniref:PID-CTERM protein-sorting domain-containing protein n=1 Tax=Aridibaculum aurantiacum TaxID=2810307 RepID=UPI001A957FFE|nr:hypothetical protein [Aridibaculum aurantiacum]